MKVTDIKENLNAIISMVEQAEKFVVIVSPFSNLSGWEELKTAINDATEREVDVRYYVRKGEGYNGIEELKVRLYEVPGLHAKMFYSEKEALISSGNLDSRPDINWVCRLDRDEEAEELSMFFRNYIEPAAELYET
jgi:phosphatidylserine/phosphatidylglycerophosphate/cardiolipin synthase-like enzyme